MSGLVGVQEPRLFHYPEWQTSMGDAAIDLAKIAGLYLDPWQQLAVRHILGEREAEEYFNEVLGANVKRSSAYETALIVARQNGKGAILEAIELAWLYLLGAKTVVHSAHEFATSREHFQRLEARIRETPELRGELARGGIKWSHGDESITLATGQRLLFKTRTKGAARGFSPDKVVMDEAMYLKDEAVAAMKYATSARPDAQIVYTGSAGDKDSVHFGRARARGIAGSDPRLLFLEWSADVCDEFCSRDCAEHDDPADPQTWARANPGIGYRLREETVRSEFLGDSREIFLRERLSVGDWPSDGDPWAVVPDEAWSARLFVSSAPKEPYALAIDTTPDLRYSTIVVSARNEQDRRHVEITGRAGWQDHRPGTAWVVDRVCEILESQPIRRLVIDKGSQAGRFVDALVEKGHESLLVHPTAREYAQACGEFYSACVRVRGSGEEPDLVHIGQTDLTDAVAGADKRELADLWAWDKRNSRQVISPLVAATLALWGLKKIETEPDDVEPWGFWE